MKYTKTLYLMILSVVFLLFFCGCKQSLSENLQSDHTATGFSELYQSTFYNLQPKRVISCTNIGPLTSYNNKVSIQTETISYDVEKNTIAAYQVDDGLYYATIDKENDISITLPDGNTVSTGQELTWLSSSGESCFHFAGTNDNMYFLNEIMLYRLNNNTLEIIDDNMQWCGIGLVNDKIYAISHSIKNNDDCYSLYLLSGSTVEYVDDLPLTSKINYVCGGDNLYFISDTTLYMLHDATPVQMTTFFDLGIDGRKITDMNYIDNHLILTTDEGYYSLVKTTSAETKEENSLTIGYFADSRGDFYAAISEYNSLSEVRIEPIEYQTLLDFQVSLTSGNIPDLLCLTDLDQMRLCSSKGYFMSLSSYLEQKNNIQDYYKNVLYASAENQTDEVFFIAPFFTLSAFEVPKTIARDIQKINTLAQMDLLVAEHDASIYSTHLKSEMLSTLLCDGYTQFINYETRKSDFSLPVFYELLRFCNRFAYSEEDLVLDDIIPVFTVVNVNSLTHLRTRWYRCLERTPYGEGLCYMPMPLSKFNGPSVQGRYYIGITRKCKNTDEAQKLLDYLLSDEQQRKAFASNCFPVNKLICRETWLQDASEGDKDYTKLMESLTTELESLIECADHYDATTYPEVVLIVLEEASAYFAGAKSIEETVQLIENRVNLYLSEISCPIIE